MGKAKRKRKNKMAKKKVEIHMQLMIQEITISTVKAVNEWWIKEQEIMDREFIYGTGEKPKGFMDYKW